ncbi:hypothetical protein Ocin01_08117 [Orchesella cincta]|uniref:Uncharacterized protein n=1 Tax=Orchesella cincta TaxID=48709 RepID=A0A1D2MZZ3_ORCCI|nr:hypothetical protein Ocin01_08117 [Orchesella cincta]
MSPVFDFFSKVTGTLPRVPCDTSLWTHLSDLQLADPNYYQPGEIDILLGADVVASIMREGRRQGASNTPIAQNSIFGWVLSGRVSTIQQTIINSNVATCRLDSLVERFWKVEELPNRKPLTLEEKACEQFFQTTTTRDSTEIHGTLPFHPSSSQHPSKALEILTLAERRLHQLERRFEKYPNQHAAYIKFMKEYIDLGHMEEAAPTTSAVLFLIILCAKRIAAQPS